MVSFTITLVRHAETSANKMQIFQGHMDADLSSDGEAQIRLLGAHLSKECFTHAFSSDLIRCKKTVEGVIKANTVFRPSIEYDVRLRERKYMMHKNVHCLFAIGQSFGVQEGCPIKEYLEKMKSCNLPDKSMYTPEGGETLEDMNSRVLSFFRDLCAMVKKLEEDTAAGRSSPSRYTRGKSAPPLISSDSVEALVSNTRDTAQTEMTSADCSAAIDVVGSVLRPGAEYPQDCTEPFIHPGKTWDEYQQESIANVLVMTHGGVIRTWLIYLCDVHSCQFESREQVMKICPNTGVTRLIVFMYPDRPMRIICVNIHDVSHLQTVAP